MLGPGQSNPGPGLQKTQSSLVILVAVRTGVNKPRSVVKHIHGRVERAVSPPRRAQIGLLGRLRRRDDMIPGDHGLVVWQVGISWADGGTDSSRVTRNAAEGFDLRILRVEGSRHPRRKGFVVMVVVVITLVRRPTRQGGTRRAVRVGSRGGSKIVGRHPKLTGLAFVVVFMFRR